MYSKTTLSNPRWLLGRALASGGGTVRSVAEIVGYPTIVAVVTLATERALLRESVGYLWRAAQSTALAA